MLTVGGRCGRPDHVRPVVRRCCLGSWTATCFRRRRMHDRRLGSGRCRLRALRCALRCLLTTRCALHRSVAGAGPVAAIDRGAGPTHFLLAGVAVEAELGVDRRVAAAARSASVPAHPRLTIAGATPPAPATAPRASRPWRPLAERCGGLRGCLVHFARLRGFALRLNPPWFLAAWFITSRFITARF